MLQRVIWYYERNYNLVMFLRSCVCRLHSPITSFRLLNCTKRIIPALYHGESASRKTKFPSDVVSKRLFSSFLDGKHEKVGSTEIVVYVAPLKKKIKLVKIISLSSSILGLFVQPFVVYDILRVSLVGGIVVGVVSTLFVSTPLILNWLMKRYVTELVFNPGTKVFTAKTLNLINQECELKFTAEDVSVPTLPGILSSMLVKKTPLFVDANLILCPDSYSHMMGYDKPFDYGISKVDEEKI